ncbi:hypothetical protein CRG98_040163 [Punica granatum]|uniref:Major facilitator superfamily (MFS) profile domain-containing protein n=1 Tax=Punica granatum TaxID=22663 RepID=A0A2I0I680_PUNGR|nr:hypothetical protein CRG98_040163 [Punica granatum]
MNSDPERPTLSSLGRVLLTSSSSSSLLYHREILQNVGKSSGEIDRAQEPLINGTLATSHEHYSVAAAVLPFLFPALGGLLYGYDIGATSCATISIEVRVPCHCTCDILQACLLVLAVLLELATSKPFFPNQR